MNEANAALFVHATEAILEDTHGCLRAAEQAWGPTVNDLIQIDHDLLSAVHQSPVMNGLIKSYGETRVPEGALPVYTPTDIVEALAAKEAHTLMPTMGSASTEQDAIQQLATNRRVHALVREARNMQLMTEFPDVKKVFIVQKASEGA